ncbi:gibberellin 2-beta-dioxygenase 8-like isoform X2 [Camellia sinensis]|uniref:gibberellin 2-beta-dioxygenase 8-like isoform X2 n=1 Tax=Camellia sinensis TaxID=4442 RepID=UPI001035724A|nr:gibberellin 2-beta-dioxygenase 8-like isoform X2 [Camellia sinensis]
MESEPPFQEIYKTLFVNFSEEGTNSESVHEKKPMILDEYEIPLVDLSRLSLCNLEQKEGKRELASAANQWGLFQVVNHGVSCDVLTRLQREQVKLFRQPFQNKALNSLADYYSWGAPNAATFMQFSWSEAFHIPLNNMPVLKEFNSNLRYPPCPVSSSKVYGMVPHTDSDFLTILCQDHVGGLQVAKDGKWVSVKPNPEALIIIIGDLFQAWSNGVYKSIEHRVVTNHEVERFSVGYFFCPTIETVIQTCKEPPLYRKFSFREYRGQVQEDVKTAGTKIGLSKFLM